MEIDSEKNKAMLGVRDVTEEEVMKVDGSVLVEQVKEFKYLGVTLTENTTSEMEVKRRIGSAASALARLDNIW